MPFLSKQTVRNIEHTAYAKAIPLLQEENAVMKEQLAQIRRIFDMVDDNGSSALLLKRAVLLIIDEGSLG